MNCALGVSPSLMPTHCDCVNVGANQRNCTCEVESPQCPSEAAAATKPKDN